MSEALQLIVLLAVIALAICAGRWLLHAAARSTADQILADVASGKTSQPREYKLSLETNDEALVVHELSGKETKHTTLNWSEITRARVYKRDLFTTDMICLFLERADGTGLELNEDEFKGWSELLEQLPQRLPGTLEDWWSDVAFPAFATTEITIFQRGNLAAS